MIVIADTSPLNYLVLTGEIEILSRLYQSVIIPEEVLTELQSPATPVSVLDWSRELPSWLKVKPVKTIDTESDVAVLGSGERAAIALALELGENALLLMDEAKGRRAAKHRNISVIGTLGVLDAAAEQGLVDMAAAVKQLRQTNFHVAPRLLGRLLDQDIERKRRQSLPKN